MWFNVNSTKDGNKKRTVTGLLTEETTEGVTNPSA